MGVGPNAIVVREVALIYLYESAQNAYKGRRVTYFMEALLHNRLDNLARES